MCLLATVPAEAQELGDLPLDRLLDTPISVSSLTERPVDEAPGVASVITHDEIEASGARSLEDLLIFVPGVTPGQDEQNVHGYGVRGLWGMEGKILVLLDGVRLNEPLYGNTVFARQFSVDHIDRIEILRGPASAVYGEYGELAVLNIVTRGPENRGGSVATTYGQGTDTYNRRSVSAGWWGRKGDADLSVSAIAGGGHLDGGEYTDKYGEIFSLDRFTGQSYECVNGGVGYKGLSARLAINSLRQDSRMSRGYGADGVLLGGVDRPLRTDYDTYAFESRYAWKPTATLSVTPRLTYYRSNSWRKKHDWVFDVVEDPHDARHEFRDFPNSRILGAATASWQATRDMTIVVGAELSHESIRANLPEIAAGDPWHYYYFYGANPTRVTGEVHSFFGEYGLRTRLFDLTVGGRLDKNERFPTARLPRIALTRRWGSLYAKALASRAYHPPTLMTVTWQDESIRPEFATEYDAELGWGLGDRLLVRANAFAIQMKPVILYSGTFSNTSVRSRGVEGEARWHQRRWRAGATYSFYRAHYDDPEDSMAKDSAGEVIEEVTLGFPTHKLTLNGTVMLTNRISVSPGLVWFSSRYARNSSWFWDGSDSDYVPVDRTHPATLLANVFARMLFLNGWEVGAGVFNLADEKYPTITGAYVGDPPVPGPSRELVVKVGYGWR